MHPRASGLASNFSRLRRVFEVSSLEKDLEGCRGSGGGLDVVWRVAGMLERALVARSLEW